MHYAMDDAMRAPMRGAMEGALRRAFWRVSSLRFTHPTQSRAAGHRTDASEEAVLQAFRTDVFNVAAPIP